MRKIIAIAWKDAIIRFISPSELLFFIILPLFFTFLLAGGTGQQDSDNRLHLLVSDEAHSPASANLIAELEKSSSMRPEVLELAEAEKQFEKAQEAALLLIPLGFDQDSLQAGGMELELRQQPNSINALAIARAVQAVTGRLGSAVQIAESAVEAAERERAFPDEATRRAYFNSALEEAQQLIAEAPSRLTVEQASTADPIDYDPGASSSAGQLITWVFIPLLGISSLFAYEREEGTLRRLLVTPTSRSTYLMGTLSGQVFSALVQMFLLVSFGIFVMKLNWGRQPFALAVLLSSFAVCAAALGAAMGAFIKTSGQANGLSIMIGMVFALMGGCWYPLELFPAFVQLAVKVLPTTWAMQGMLDLALRGGGLADIILESCVLLGFAALFFVIGVLRFRYE